MTDHNNPVYSVRFSLDGQTLTSGGSDQTVRLWDVSNIDARDTGLCFKRLVGHAIALWSVAFTPDGQTLASASADKMVRLWDVQTGRTL